MGEASGRRRMAMLGVVALGLALLLSATPLAGASSVGPALTNAPPPNLRIGFLQLVDSLNPFIGINQPSLVLYSLLYDDPFSFDQDGNYVSNLITNASCANQQCSVWNYTVRQGVYWSDGTKFAAADVNFSWNYESQNFGSLWAYEPYFNQVVQCNSLTRPHCGAVVSSTNPNQVILYFQHPFAAGKDLLAPVLQKAQWQPIKPACAGGSAGCTNASIYQNANPIGTGPFIADPNILSEVQNQLQTGVSIHVSRNPKYHPVGGSTPNASIANLYLYTYSDPTAMSKALEAGDLDLAQFTTSTVGPVIGQPNILVQSALQAFQTWNYIGISQCDTGAADLRLNPSRWDFNVREALARATNKDYIVQDIYNSQGVRGDTLVSPITPQWWYDPVAGGDNLTFNIARANAILNQSGYATWSGGSFGNGVRSATNPITVSIQSSAGALRVENITNVTKTIPMGTSLTFTLAVRPPAVYPEEYTTAQYLRQQWSQIGVQVNIKAETTESALSGDVYGCNVEMYIWYWSSNPDPNYMLSMQSSWTLDGWNDNNWVNTTYNRLYLAELGDSGLTQRMADVQAAERLQYEQAPDIIYLYPYGEWAMRTDLWQGWGNWSAHPYRQWNVPWGANPLWFNVTCPSCAAVPPPPPPPTIGPAGSINALSGVNVTFTANASISNLSTQLNFTWYWGDGSSTRVVTTSANPTSSYGHVWLSPGDYEVSVSLYDGHGAPTASTNQVMVNVFSPTSAGHLVGTVTNGLGKPVPGVGIWAAPGNWASSTSASGTYNIALPAGTYAVTANASWATPQTQTGVSVISGGVTTLNFTLLPPPGWINGTVLDAASGAPIVGAVVLARSGIGTPQAGSSDSGGRFNLTAEPGTYTVNFSASGYASQTQTGVIATSRHATSLTKDLLPSVNPIQVQLAPALGRPGEPTAFAGNVTTPGSGTWTLDFGDGSNATAVHGAGTSTVLVNHTYASEGVYTVRLTASSHLVRANVIATAVVDGTPPLTTAALVGTAGTGAWYRSPVEVSLPASDALSGLAETLYRLDGGSLQTYSGTFTISADGGHTLQYYSWDRAGNVEVLHTLSIDVDTTPPSVRITSPSSAGTVSSAQATVSWTGSDSTSRIDHYEVSIDGGAREDVGTKTSFNADLPDGSHTITVWAVDAAGNNASALVTFRTDTNPFSPSGPYAGAPTYAIIAGAVALTAFVLWRRRKRAGVPPSPPPAE